VIRVSLEQDGYEATRQIRDPASNALNHDVPIIALTAHTMKGDRENCLEAGMNDYVVKPVNPGTLVESIGKWLLDDEKELSSHPMQTGEISSRVWQPGPTTTSVNLLTTMSCMLGWRLDVGLSGCNQHCRREFRSSRTLSIM